MSNATCGLCRTSRVNASDSRTLAALITYYPAATRGTYGGHIENSFTTVSLLGKRANNLGNNLTGLAHNNGVADTDIALGDELIIMKGGT